MANAKPKRAKHSIPFVSSSSPLPCLALAPPRTPKTSRLQGQQSIISKSLPSQVQHPKSTPLSHSPTSSTPSATCGVHSSSSSSEQSTKQCSSSASPTAALPTRCHVPPCWPQLWPAAPSTRMCLTACHPPATPQSHQAHAARWWEGCSRNSSVDLPRRPRWRPQRCRRSNPAAAR